MLSMKRSFITSSLSGPFFDKAIVVLHSSKFVLVDCRGKIARNAMKAWQAYSNRVFCVFLMGIPLYAFAIYCKFYA